MAKMMEMVFHAKEGDDTLIIETLRGTAIFISMKPVETKSGQRKVFTRHFSKETRTDSLAMKVLKNNAGRKFSAADMAPFFTEEGFSGSSASSTLSHLAAANTIKRERVGKNFVYWLEA